MGLDPNEILEQMTLSKSEQIAVEHYRKKPEGRGFFSVAEIMAKHKQWDEAIQLLSRGLERHPSYSVARVFLVQLLFQRRHLNEAWATLNLSPIPLKGNLTALILRLKLAVLLGFSAETQDAIKDIAQHDHQEKDIRIIIEQMAVKPFAEVRREYADYLKIPFHTLPADKVEGASAAQSAEQFLATAHRDQLQEEQSFRERVARGFFASPIQGLFSKPVAPASPYETDLDELTRARLFRRQGVYQKAYDIYNRLVHASPTNDLLRREFAEIRELRDTQLEIDRRSNPVLVESLEKVRKIDARIKILTDLLSALDRHGYDH